MHAKIGRCKLKRERQKCDNTSRGSDREKTSQQQCAKVGDHIRRGPFLSKCLCQKSTKAGLGRLKPSGQQPADDQHQDEELQRPDKLLSSWELPFFPRLAQALL